MTDDLIEDREALAAHLVALGLAEERPGYGHATGAQVADAALAWFAARQPAPVDAKTTTEWGVRRETKHFGTVIDRAATKESALWTAKFLRDPAVINHTPSAVAVSRTVTTTPWQEVRDV